MISKIYLNRYVRISDNYFVRMRVGRNTFYIKDTRAKKFPSKDLDLFLSYKKTRGGKKLFFIAEAASGLRFTKYYTDKIKAIQKAQETTKYRSTNNISIFIERSVKVRVSPRFRKIINTPRYVAAN